MRTILRHILPVMGILFFCLGIPSLVYAHAGTLFSSGTDAVSGASVTIPDQPSGTFLILLQSDRHPKTKDAWTAFFQEQAVDVIMEDLSCLVCRGDPSALELAERYQARLAENQMRIRIEDGTMIASKADQGLFDMILISQELADAYDYQTLTENPDLYSIRIGEEAS